MTSQEATQATIKGKSKMIKYHNELMKTTLKEVLKDIKDTCSVGLNKCSWLKNHHIDKQTENYVTEYLIQNNFTVEDNIISWPENNH